MAHQRKPYSRARRWERPHWEPKPQPETLTLRENEEHDGYELLFPAQPNDSVKAEIKAAGWKYIYRGEHIWYIKRSPASKEFADKLIERLSVSPYAQYQIT